MLNNLHFISCILYSIFISNKLVYIMVHTEKLLLSVQYVVADT